NQWRRFLIIQSQDPNVAGGFRILNPEDNPLAVRRPRHRSARKIGFIKQFLRARPRGKRFVDAPFALSQGAKDDLFAVGRPDRHGVVLGSVLSQTCIAAARFKHPNVASIAVMTMDRHPLGVWRNVYTAINTLWPDGLLNLSRSRNPRILPLGQVRLRACRT